MSVWQSPASPLCGSEGELVSVSISVDPRELEELLEALSQLDFPVNPQIYHAEGQSPDARTIVEFPAYSGGLPQLHATLAAGGQDSAAVRVRGMLEEIQSLLGHETGRRSDDPS
jgi:hypothetical protein